MDKQSLSDHPLRQSVLDSFITAHKLAPTFASSALAWFIPTIDKIISHHDSAKQTIIVGVNGSQGSGKSTFCALACELINQLSNKTAATISLDDFYLSSEQRKLLALQKHSLLATRGVPGTHDTDFIKQVFTNITNGNACTLPRFDKSTDNPKPKEQWLTFDTPPDIVFFEGWCWGVQAQEDNAVLNPISDFEQNKDAFGIWRTYVNESLKTQYQPLYKYCSFWVMLQAPSFASVFNWRCEQEHKLRALFPDADGVMSDQQVAAFIQHYERLTNHCLQTLPDKCDVVFELSENRSIKGVNHQ